MPVGPDRQQISINDERAIIERIDALARDLGRSRSELYELAARLLLAHEEAIRTLRIWDADKAAQALLKTPRDE